jgi:hypothetical protein
MTGRDRIVMIVVVVVAVLGLAWLGVVKPERQKASKLGDEVSTAKSQLASAEGQLANARSDQARYAAAYTSVVSLGKAVPVGQEVPSLIYQLAQASNHKKVDFASIVAGTGSGASGSAASASSGAASAATATATAAGFTQMPFTFIFNGSYFDLEHLFGQLNHFTQRTSSGDLLVSGRLLTIQSVKLAPLTQGSERAKSGPPRLTGTITATAYVLPANQGLTGGATASSPSGTGTSPASSTSPSGSPTAPAIVKVTP